MPFPLRAFTIALSVLTATGSEGPCRTPHPNVSQNHIAPRTPKIAILGIQYADWTGKLINGAKLREWFDGRPVDFIRRVSGGCTDITYETFVTIVSENEKKDDDSCRTQSNDMESLTLPDIPGYDQGDFYATIVVPVGKFCSTSASVGKGLSLNIDGETVSLNKNMFMGRRWDSTGNQDQDQSDGDGSGSGGVSSAEDPIGNRVYVHELMHLFGAGYHSNAKACNNPGIDQKDILACPHLEYGDLFDVLGSSGGLAANINARLRYNFGWLGEDDLAVFNKRGSSQLSPLQKANKIPDEYQNGTTTIYEPVAAVLPTLGIWIEWRSEMDSPFSSTDPLADNGGFFVRHDATLVDADLHTCDSNAFGTSNDDWTDERLRTTLLPGKNLLFQSHGVILQADPEGVHPTDNTMTLHVHYTGAAPPCLSGAPHIATGMVGEWKFCDKPTRARCDFRSNGGLDSLAGYTRTTLHVMNGVDDSDSKGCGDGSGDAVYDLAVKSELPSGWAFAGQRVSGWSIGGCVDAGLCDGPKWSPIGGGFAFGVPDDAEDGDYDFCIAVVKRTSGLMAAKILRVSLPEEDNEWYTNNRPKSYMNVNEELKAMCDELNGSCAEGRDCVMPLSDNCQVDLACPAAVDDTSMSDWGRCWANDGAIDGVRYRGRNFDTVTQSVCTGGPPLLESETCGPPSLISPCTDQRSCKRPSTIWKQLSIENGDTTGICGRCKPGSNCNSNMTGLCHENGPGYDEPICDKTSSSGGGYLMYNHPCRIGVSTFNETCVRELCEESDLCGGYMVEEYYQDVTFYPTDISRPTYQNPTNPYTCWKKPAEGETTCTCIGGPLVPSEGCTKFGFNDLEQWVGPACNITTESSPPSTTPTEKCTELKRSKFLYKEANGNTLTKSCRWLDMVDGRAEKVCEKMVAVTQIHNSAQYTCRKTCLSCSACYENRKSKFFLRTKKKGAKAVLKTCKWLTTNPKREAHCLLTKMWKGYGPPSGVCPVACALPGDDCYIG